MEMIIKVRVIREINWYLILILGMMVKPKRYPSKIIEI